MKNNNVLFMATTLGLVLTVGVLTTTQQVFAVTMGGRNRAVTMGWRKRRNRCKWCHVHN
jgi:hypothetical protein